MMEVINEKSRIHAYQQVYQRFFRLSGLEELCYAGIMTHEDGYALQNGNTMYMLDKCGFVCNIYDC